MPRPDTLRVRGQADQPLEEGLPKGGVAEVEAAMDVVEAAPEQQMAEPTEAAPADMGLGFIEEDIPGLEEEDVDEDLLDPDDKLVFQPTFDPGTPVTAGLGQTTATRIPPPESVVEWLPVLAQAARAPDAPEQVKALLRLVTYHLRG